MDALSLQLGAVVLGSSIRRPRPLFLHRVIHSLSHSAVRLLADLSVHHIAPRAACVQAVSSHRLTWPAAIFCAGLTLVLSIFGAPL
jgi:hypothetical protein